MADRTLTFPVHPAYVDSTNTAPQGRKMIKAATDPSFKQGDVNKTVRTMYKFTTLQNPPLHFAIGQDTLCQIERQHADVQREIDTYKSWSADLKED